MRYDALVIGAGADGLAAAAVLAARGLSVVVVERDSRPGGRCSTREFHPGFKASPFCDVLPEIPPSIFRALDLARRGAIFAPAARNGMTGFAAEAEALRQAVLERALADAGSPPPRGLFGRPPPRPWPGDALATRSLIEAETAAADIGRTVLDSGTLCDPTLAGSALLALVWPPGGMVAGGLGKLGEALHAAASEAGAEISCGLEVTDVRGKAGRVMAAGLADGGEIAARAIVSTLDLKRTFLSLFPWNELPRSLVERIGAFRPAPGMARLLVALEAPPDLPRDPIYVPHSVEAAYRAWRSATLTDEPPAVVRLVTAVDPSLAPEGGAVATVTLYGIPHTPFDGAWSNEKRSRLRDTALAILDRALPGAQAAVKATELITPPDLENQLALSEGDLSGGELSAEQMLGFRPFPECRGARTPVEGLYLAGLSSALGPLATCAAGLAAARAVIADIAAGRLR